MTRAYGGLLRDIDEGYSKRMAIVVPPGAVWPLPAYELALMTAGEARAMGHDDVQVTVVTPERAPLSLFGDEASAAVAEELKSAGVDLTGAVARRDGGGLRARAQRRAARRPARVRRAAPARARRSRALPADEEGFILAGDDGRVEGRERTWAAGDGIDSPLKFGGLATHQARRAAAGIARRPASRTRPIRASRSSTAGCSSGSARRRLRGRGDAEGAPLWWPQGKVAGEYLPRWLAEHGVAAAGGTARRRTRIAIRRPCARCGCGGPVPVRAAHRFPAR